MGGAAAGRGPAGRRQLRPVAGQRPAHPRPAAGADPLAEGTVQEAATTEWGALAEGDNAVGLVSAGHLFQVLTQADITPEAEPASDHDNDQPAPEPSLGIHSQHDRDRTR